jgi:hypothetical protein
MKTIARRIAMAESSRPDSIAMAVHFYERTIGYDVRVPLTHLRKPSLFTVFWPSVFERVRSQSSARPFHGPNHNLFANVDEMIAFASTIPRERLMGCVVIEITELRGVRAKNDRGAVDPLPAGVRRRGLVGYDLGDYYLCENRGASGPLWPTPELAFKALREIREIVPSTRAVFGIYELDCSLAASLCDEEQKY